MGFAVGGYGVATVLKIVQYSPTMPSLCGWGGFLKTFFLKTLYSENARGNRFRMLVPLVHMQSQHEVYGFYVTTKRQRKEI